MKNKKKAVRRHHRRRLKNKRKGYWSNTEKTSGTVIDTPCMCSCWMCGNPRMHFNAKTRQEELE